MTDLILIISRFVEYSGAMVLFGSSLFLLYGKPVAANAPASDLRWTKHLLTAAASILALGTVTGFLAQTTGLAGSFGAALEIATFKAALLQMNFGPASLIRLMAALLAIIAAIRMQPARPAWLLCCLLGAVSCATFSWMGHGAATEGSLGWLHLAGDIVHSLAAAGWIGALVVFCVLLTARIPAPTDRRMLAASLAQFSTIGTVFVAVIIGSGLINSAFLVGWDPARIVSTRYGQVLIAKLVLFASMLVLAAYNRFRHTPALANALRNSGPSDQAMGDLRRSVFVETCIAAAVLVLVGWLGMLEPVTA